ncbi:hypothetical protein [Paenibacillus sp. 1P03SA]|uniref:hypothetical protein n=1 Tax=Paenibacillus sp. 1P03SA TaxID=3132294 RepID=UPI0039A1ECA5
MYTNPKKTDWSKLVYNGTYWQITGGEYDIFVKGDEAAPAEEYLDMAKTVTANIEEHMERAVRFLGEFLKLKGEWSLNTLDFGCCYSGVRHDFELTLDFEEEGDVFRFVYTTIVVSFDIRSFSVQKEVKPQRIEIGFR